MSSTITQPFDPALFLKTTTHQSGVYQMLGAQDEMLYIGKARNLKKRLTSYFRGTQSLKTAALVKQIQRIEVIVTHTENEALLLECLLIKQHKPYYNVLLRDDKSYPYIVLTNHTDFPRLDFYRGAKNNKQRYFGPYPSTVAVRETLHFLQKIFRLRSCQDDFFRHRQRPCLQYQINRCTAPCVQFIDQQSYQNDVKRAVLFLEGKSQEIIADLAQQMDVASQQLDFEKAARVRDQIAILRQIQQQQIVIGDQVDSDIIAVVARHGVMCVQVLSVRNGRLLGSRSFFPTVPAQSTEQEVLAAFLPQYYFAEAHAQDIPKQIFLNQELPEANWLATALTEQVQRQVKFITHPRGERARLLELAEQNANQALQQHLTERSIVYKRLLALQELLQLENLPQRLECFDISHSQGEATVASCVVFDETGPSKKDYRRFNIEGITAGDDYSAMKQALTRRYLALKNAEEKLPDVLIIDGGKGQLKQAEEVLEELQISHVKILGVAKGPTRKAGLERLFLAGRVMPLATVPDSPALHLIQQIRDEAHRFAITGHRNRRAKTRNSSVLESITGIGSKRRRELLRQFGGLQELKRASVEDMAKVPGISKALAKKISEALQKL